MEIFGSDPLAVFLREAAQRPFMWGSHDCLLFLADWVSRRTGSDPAGELRGSYTTEAEAKRLIVKAGGMAALIDARMPGKRTEVPGRGDIGLIETPSGLTGCIVTNGGNVALGRNPDEDKGSLLLWSRTAEVPIVAAWRV